MLTKFAALLACTGLLLYAGSSQPETPSNKLFQAVQAGDLAAVRSALAAGGEVNAKDPEGATPLMYAAFYPANADCLRLLLERGAEPNIANAVGATALILGNREPGKSEAARGTWRRCECPL